MTDMELTEDQFKLIKTLCLSQSLLVFVPESREDDKEEVKKECQENKDNFLTLLNAGFVEDVTDKCEDQIKESVRRGGRSFKAYSIKQEAYDIFLPPEGVIN